MREIVAALLFAVNSASGGNPGIPILQSLQDAINGEYGVAGSNNIVLGLCAGWIVDLRKVSGDILIGSYVGAPPDVKAAIYICDPAERTC